MTQEQPRNQEVYTEEEVEIEVGRDAASGQLEPVHVAEGDRYGAIVHRFKRIIARGPLGRFVKRR